ncbi:MAG: hypothetical protein R6U02_00205 [Alkalibacterium sp.]|uniref:hypothetical protein n=1 Tax=Alkalibacterium sp. TaxID=1872447 RepID=UPI0039711132
MLDSVISQLVKIEQAAQDMQSTVDLKKNTLRKIYEDKQKEFDVQIDQQTQQQLEKIQQEINRKEEVNKKELNKLYEAEILRLEKDYRQKKEDIVQEIVTHILKD